MQWREFLEKSVPARLEQEVYLKVFDDESADFMLVPIADFEFTSDMVIIRQKMDWQ